MAQKVVVWDDSTDHLVRSDKDVSEIGTGSSNSRSDCVALTNGTTSKVFTFSSSLPNTSYTVNATILNSADSNPLFQPVFITNKTVGGFTAIWNNPIDSANYEICYSASPDGFSFISATESITSGVTFKTVTLSPALSDTNFVVTANFSNSSDPSPIFQPLVVTSKTTEGFTATWNSPTDTANYALEYHINLVS